MQLRWLGHHPFPGAAYILDTTNTRAFMIFEDGKIVVEYSSTIHEVRQQAMVLASASKSLTSVMIACAQADGKLQLTEIGAKYLGNGLDLMYIWIRTENHHSPSNHHD